VQHGKIDVRVYPGDWIIEPGKKGVIGFWGKILFYKGFFIHDGPSTISADIDKYGEKSLFIEIRVERFCGF
jgi:hypothetical protein